MTTTAITSIRLAIAGAEIALGIGEHVIGRAADCAVALTDQRASRRHAVLTVAPELVSIRDLESRNGVIVNGIVIPGPTALHEGDVIVLGKQAIQVRWILHAAVGEGGPRVGSGKRRAAADRDADPALAAAITAATTLSHSLVPLGRPVEAFRTIAEAASEEIARGHVDYAERMLEAPLVEVLATLRAGIPVDEEILTIVIDQASALHAAGGDPRWLEYIEDLRTKLGAPLSAAIARRIAQAARR